MTSRWSDEYLEQYREYIELCRKYRESALHIENNWLGHWYALKFLYIQPRTIEKEKNMSITKRTMIPDPDTDKFLLQVFKSNDDICLEVFLTEPSIPRSLIPLCDRYKIQIWEIHHKGQFSTGIDYVPYSGKIGFYRE